MFQCPSRSAKVRRGSFGKWQGGSEADAPCQEAFTYEECLYDRASVRQRKLAAKYEIFQQYVEILKKKCEALQNGEWHRKWSPELDSDQRQRRCCRQLVRKICQPSYPIEIIMDDKSYFHTRRGQLENVGITPRTIRVPPGERFAIHEKFLKSHVYAVGWEAATDHQLW